MLLDTRSLYNCKYNSYSLTKKKKKELKTQEQNVPWQKQLIY